MQKLLPHIASMFLLAGLAQGQNTSSQFDTSRFVFTSIHGIAHNVVLYAPKPVFPPAALQQHLSGRGIYKLDLDNGTPYDVRIIRSTGHKILDDAALEALRQWRFLPHRMVWVTIPIEFRAPSSSTPVKRKSS
jgi:TonB family protein